MIQSFETADIVLAAALKVKGCILESMTKKGNKCTFIFVDVPDELISDYDYGKLLCEVQAFNSAVHALTTGCRRKE